jgi:hypothetical protein
LNQVVHGLLWTKSFLKNPKSYVAF